MIQELGQTRCRYCGREVKGFGRFNIRRHEEPCLRNQLRAKRAEMRRLVREQLKKRTAYRTHFRTLTKLAHNEGIGSRVVPLPGQLPLPMIDGLPAVVT